MRCLLQDFSSQNRTTYKFAHVYFTEGERGRYHILIFYKIFPISSLSWRKIQGDLQLAGCQENQNSEGNQHRLHSPRVPGLLPGQQGQLPAVLQPSESLREERWHGEDGRADRHSLFHPGGISLHQIQSVRVIKLINQFPSDQFITATTRRTWSWLSWFSRSWTPTRLTTQPWARALRKPSLSWSSWTEVRVKLEIGTRLSHLSISGFDITSALLHELTFQVKRCSIQVL